MNAAAAYVAHRADAESALALFRSYCELPLPRVPGMDTVIRLAFRIANGRDIEAAAAREYLYRWHLAIKAPDQCDAAGETQLLDPCVSVFGAPHTIGM